MRRGSSSLSNDSWLTEGLFQATFPKKLELENVARLQSNPEFACVDEEMLSCEARLPEFVSFVVANVDGSFQD